MEQNAQHANAIPQDLKFQLLEDITEKFSEKHKVGSGGYGEVFKGQLPSGEVIAVKKLYRIEGLDDVEFKKEFNNLMKAQHRNIIRLVAYSHETREKYVEIEKGQYVFAKEIDRALCFEYMTHGSLDKHLSDEYCGPDWHTRYKIIRGVCEDLNYLHNESRDCMYHLDLKPANILLDESMTPKIADFGLSRLFGKSETYTAKTFKGTLGYMPPEYIDKRHISRKYDVFSLGVIIIQTMAGPLGYSKCAEMSSQKQFAELVHENWEKRLQETSRHTSQAASLEVKTCIEMALRCVEPDRRKRPTIAEIIIELNEMEKLKRSLLFGQSSESKVQRVEIDPLELRFPFELNKQISCVLQLTNKSDDFVAFRAKLNLSKYSARPDKGVMAPRAKRYVVATMQAQEAALPDMRCPDTFLVQSAAVSKGFLPGDITESLFRRSEDANEAVVDEVELPIVYVAIPET